MMPAGSINGWLCKKCSRLTIVIHRDEGVTPFVLACRADGFDPTHPMSSCDGFGESCGYPVDPPPRPPEWEFYRPDDRELQLLDQKHPGMWFHVKNGGLNIRRIPS